MGRTCLLIQQTGCAFRNVRKSYKKLKELNMNICAGVTKGGAGWIFQEANSSTFTTQIKGTLLEA